MHLQSKSQCFRRAGGSLHKPLFSQQGRGMTTEENPTLINVPMPIRTPRLLIRPKRPGDGASIVAAVIETWDDLHRWMAWAENLDDFTVEQQEIRIRQQMARFILREEFNLLGVEIATGHPVIWCGFHDIDWKGHQCDTGFWVRKSAQGRGFASESTNALLRYAFGALGMRRVGITHSEDNRASRRIVEKLGFSPDGIDKAANLLPGGRIVDRYCYARLDLSGLPPLDVEWG
jgi:RimJ/RimL family protein N-acetyltransferase